MFQTYEEAYTCCKLALDNAIRYNQRDTSTCALSITALISRLLPAAYKTQLGTNRKYMGYVLQALAKSAEKTTSKIVDERAQIIFQDSLDMLLAWMCECKFNLIRQGV